MRQLTKKERNLIVLLVLVTGGVGYLWYQRLAASPATSSEAARAAVKAVDAGGLPPLTPVLLDATRTVQIR